MDAIETIIKISQSVQINSNEAKSELTGTSTIMSRVGNKKKTKLENCYVC